MKALIDSLSIGSGAVLIALLSAAVVWLLCSVVPSASRSLWIYLVPFILAYSLYWSPVWLGNDSSEYGAWALLFVGAWFVAGAIPAAVIALIFRKRRI
jgi:hypothetical protein